MAKATIRNFSDAIVELVTNSDDSYKRAEKAGLEKMGVIKIFVSREKGGKCKEFRVIDFAEGMFRGDLRRAIEFGGETSGFDKDRTVRGLFGRGLKESIISLGEGEIYTIKDNRLNIARIWWDKNKRKALYGLQDEVKDISTTQRQEIGIEHGDGTVIKIKVKNEKIRVAEYDNLKEQIRDHFALRDINSSPKREIKLIFEDCKRNGKYETKIQFEYPDGEKVFDDSINMSGSGDTIKIKIFKSPISLDSPRFNPFSKGGILIKTEGAILDNQLFRYDTDPAAFYFFGEALCGSLVDKIREGEIGIIDPNRAGIEWRHDYCQNIQKIIEKTIEPFILEKKKELEKRTEKEIPTETRKMLSKLCELLNKMAKEEFLDWEPVVEPTPDIEELNLVPKYANLEIDKPRPFSIYVPDKIIKSLNIDKAIIESDNPNIQSLSTNVTLERHSKYPELRYGVFKVVGRVIGEKGYIYCRLGDNEDIAEVRVSEPRKKEKGEPHGRKGGFISKIEPDETTDPIQRVEYKRELGEIRIYIKFPSVGKYLGPGLKGADTNEGKVILAELVGEAFFKELARRNLESGKYPIVPGAEVDTFNSAINELQKKYLAEIYEAIMHWKFK